MARPKKQRLEVKQEQEKTTSFYIVQPGENLQSIAKKFGRPLQTLVSINGPEVRPGQKILIY